MKKEQEMLDELKQRLVDLDIEGVKETCQELLNSGVPPSGIMLDGIAKGMEMCGQKYESGEYFIPHLLVAGEAMREGMNILKPHMRGEGLVKLGKVVIGTVRGDIHDMGKNIVITLLEGMGFEVIDLGSDVSVERFVAAVHKHKPDVLGMSALVTTTMDEMENVIKALDKHGLRKNLKVIGGGAPITQEFGERIGADAATNDGIAGAKICKKWILGE